MKLLKHGTALLLILSAQLGFATDKVINEEEAKKIALGKVQGEVKEVERENEHGQDVYSVEILKDGKTFEVHINPVSGAVIRVEEEGAHSKKE